MSKSRGRIVIDFESLDILDSDNNPEVITSLVRDQVRGNACQAFQDAILGNGDVRIEDFEVIRPLTQTDRVSFTLGFSAYVTHDIGTDVEDIVAGPRLDSMVIKAIRTTVSPLVEVTGLDVPTETGSVFDRFDPDLKFDCTHGGED